MNCVLGHNSARQFYTGLLTTLANDMNFGMNHIQGAGLNVQPFDLQSSAVTIYYSASFIVYLLLSCYTLFTYCYPVLCIVYLVLSCFTYCYTALLIVYLLLSCFMHCLPIVILLQLFHIIPQLVSLHHQFVSLLSQFLTTSLTGFHNQSKLMCLEIKRINVITEGATDWSY